MDAIDIGLIIGAVLMYFVNEYRKWRLKRSKASGLDDAVNRNEKIYPLLWQMLIKYGADRVYITQFHNGNNYYSGQHIQRMSVSHEAVKEGVREVTRELTDIPISETMHNMLVMLRTRGHYVENSIDSVKDIKLRETMTIYNIKSIFRVQLCNRQGDTIGILNLDFSREDVIRQREITETLISRNVIQNYLNKN